MNNKWFTRENIKAYILWGLEHTKERLCVVISDTLQAINYQVRSKYSKQAAIRKSLREGDNFFEIITGVLEELSKEKRELIDIIRWNDVKKDIAYKIAFPIFLKKFETNSEFKSEIKQIIKDFASKLDQPSMREEKIDRLGMYVIEELPELMNGFTFGGTYYNCLLYPFDGLLVQLIEEIQKKEKFPELHDELKIKSNVFVELKIVNTEK